MLKKDILSIILTLVINYFLLVLCSIFLTIIFRCSIKDSLFIIGIVSIILSLFVNFSGNPLGLSIRSMGQINTQYSSIMDLESKKNENERFKLTLNIKTLLKTTLFFSSILLIITSFILK